MTRAKRAPAPAAPERRDGRTRQETEVDGMDGWMRTCETDSNIPVLRAAGLIVALSRAAPLGGAAEYMRVGRRQPRQRVCETTCLDIVGLAACGLLESAGSGLLRGDRLGGGRRAWVCQSGAWDGTTEPESSDSRPETLKLFDLETRSRPGMHATALADAGRNARACGWTVQKSMSSQRRLDESRVE